MGQPQPTPPPTTHPHLRAPHPQKSGAAAVYEASTTTVQQMSIMDSNMAVRVDRATDRVVAKLDQFESKVLAGQASIIALLQGGAPPARALGEAGGEERGEARGEEGGEEGGEAAAAGAAARRVSSAPSNWEARASPSPIAEEGEDDEEEEMDPAAAARLESAAAQYSLTMFEFMEGLDARSREASRRASAAGADDAGGTGAAAREEAGGGGSGGGGSA
jgi:hypothetical protein